mgnify:CR=1 FL=1
MRNILRNLGNLIAAVLLSTAAVFSILMIVRPILFDRVLERLPVLLKERDLRSREEASGTPNDSLRALSQSMAGIFKKRLSGWYPLALAEAGALALTSDGWFLAPEGNWSGDVLIVRNEIYSIERIVRDENTGLNFLKVNGSRFKSAEFTSSTNRLPGTPIALVSAEQIVSTSLSGYLMPEIASAPLTALRRRFLVAGDARIPGTAVADISGKVIAIISERPADDQTAVGAVKALKGFSNAVPSDNFRFALRRLIENGFVAHHELLAEGVELAHYHSAGSNKMALSGTLINALSNDSPLIAADLKPADIILAVDKEVIQEGRTFSEIIEAIEPGRTLTLDILRAGDTFRTSLTLPEFSENNVSNGKIKSQSKLSR